jgi:hypothetical protein
MALSIKLPEGALKNVNMECNAPLSSVNARVEKVNSIYGIVLPPGALFPTLALTQFLRGCTCARFASMQNDANQGC